MSQNSATSYLKNVPVGCKQYDELCSLMRESYPKACILWIDEVCNSSLQARFNERLKSTLKGSKVLQLFHGTKEANIKPIIENGFEASYNVTSAYGKGTYFATKANYSKSYATDSNDQISFMLICDVIVGNVCRGSSNLVVDQSKYECAVDNLTNPSIYVVPNNDASYPRFQIAFYKYAV